MTNEAYVNWKSLYDDAVTAVWKNEPNVELRHISMMLFVIKREFKRISDNLEENLNEVKSNKRKLSPNLGIDAHANAVINDNKENLDFPNNNNAQLIQKSSQTSNEKTACDSPDMFQNDNLSTSASSKNDSILISDEEDFKIVSKFGSPEIKKGRRSLRFNNRRKVQSPSVFFLKDLGITTTASPSRNTQTNNLITENVNVISNKKTDERIETISPKNTNISDLDKNISCLSTDTPIKETDESKNDSLDFSLIPCTPTPVSKSSLSLKHNSKMGSFMSKNLSRNVISRKKKTKNGDKNSTLTQMFGKAELTNLSKTNKQKGTTDYDSDATCCDGEHMGITNMLSMINRTHINGSQAPSFNFGEIGSQCSKKYKETKRFQDTLPEEPESDSETVDKQPKSMKDINEILAKAQGVPDHQLDAEPVVRGKARKRLPGWACKECEKFYANQGLTDSQVVALNKCTKHRGYYRPREDTLPGYWDMSLPTQTKKKN